MPIVSTSVYTTYMATKKPTTKKAAVKKTAPKRPAAKKTTKKSSSKGLRAHIALQPEETDFMTFRITRQTLYWLVLGAVVIMFTLWLMQLQADIQTLYDQIDANSTEMSGL
jgi:hypothetical protein